MFEQIIQFTQQVPLIVQFIVTALLGAVPFIESEIAAGLAVVAGVPVVVAVVAAVLGNILSVYAVVLGAERISKWRNMIRNKDNTRDHTKKITNAIHRYGIPGASLLGPLVTGSHLLAFVAAIAGADRRYLMMWQVIAITIWGTAGGVLVAIGVDILGAK